MNYFMKSLQFLPWLLLLFCVSVSAIPMLRRPSKNHLDNNSSIDVGSSLDKDVKILFYPQTLDHFNYQPESYSLFKQKYIVSFKHWGGAKAKSPMLVYLGDEAPLANNIADELILKEYAQHFKALLVFIEHRFYGDSIPFGLSMKEVVKNESVRGYFSSAQALADHAELILHLKNKLDAHYSPVIVFGGSYGGMLASWFRLKYPHIALGALASSAPVRFFDSIISPNHGYYSIVSKDFKEMSENCYETIKRSWAEIDRVGEKPNGLSILSKKFNTCVPLKNTRKLKDFLQHMYSLAAMYNVPTISSICDAINHGSKGTDILSRIYAAILTYPAGAQQPKCQSLNWQVIYNMDTILGWDWQTCSEMVIPMEDNTSKDSMFPSKIFDLKKFAKKCKAKYNVMPRPHWVTTYYGGHDMQLVLKRFGSNIIFSNGLKDPYSVGGVLENLSNSIFAIYSQNGTHTVDLLPAQQDDPKWLVQQRQREVEIMNGWLNNYYNDLNQF